MLIRIFAGLFCGIVLALVFYWSRTLPKLCSYILYGALIGALVGYSWQAMFNIFKRFNLDEWYVKEIQINTLGHNWKLVNSGSQRRIAWTIFVEAVTRITTQPMNDDQGDNGVALKSLYDFFQDTRQIIANMEATSIMPSTRKSLDTVETYALAMLNQDIRPFLSKWHPIWDVWRKLNSNAPSSNWERHTEFRADLKTLQSKMLERVIGLGIIAGIPDIDRFIKHTSSQNN